MELNKELSRFLHSEATWWIGAVVRTCLGAIVIGRSRDRDRHADPELLVRPVDLSQDRNRAAQVGLFGLDSSSIVMVVRNCKRRRRGSVRGSDRPMTQGGSSKTIMFSPYLCTLNKAGFPFTFEPAVDEAKQILLGIGCLLWRLLAPAGVAAYNR